MKIKLQKNWRYAGQVIMAGTEMEIKNKNTIKFLEDNGYLYKKEKKEKKGKKVNAEENN
tara:strand:+ start:1702 stop:1878 length:177 start_codon:yes stop_codon:yes gene_type:complete